MSISGSDSAVGAGALALPAAGLSAAGAAGAASVAISTSPLASDGASGSSETSCSRCGDAAGSVACVRAIRTFRIRALNYLVQLAGVESSSDARQRAQDPRREARLDQADGLREQRPVIDDLCRRELVRARCNAPETTSTGFAGVAGVASLAADAALGSVLRTIACVCDRGRRLDASSVGRHLARSTWALL